MGMTSTGAPSPSLPAIAGSPQQTEHSQQHQEQPPRMNGPPIMMEDVQREVNAVLGQSQVQGQSQSQEEKERKDLNPARRPQRLYLRRERAAMPKAMTLLQETAFLLLSEEDKETIVDAIRSELNYIIDRDMDSYPRGAQVDYEKMVQNVMQKVFYDHVSLFKFDDEDEPLASELFTLGFDKDSPSQSQGQGQGQSQNQSQTQPKDQGTPEAVASSSAQDPSENPTRRQRGPGKS